jgi:NADP-dependent 3-hydroxy acid dehydrogenase YdfG
MSRPEVVVITGASAGVGRATAPRNRGCIVQLGSALAYRAIPLQAPYCGAKHAIRGCSR